MSIRDNVDAEIKRTIKRCRHPNRKDWTLTMSADFYDDWREYNRSRMTTKGDGVYVDNPIPPYLYRGIKVVVDDSTDVDFVITTIWDKSGGVEEL